MIHCESKQFRTTFHYYVLLSLSELHACSRIIAEIGFLHINPVLCNTYIYIIMWQKDPNSNPKINRSKKRTKT